MDCDTVTVYIPVLREGHSWLFSALTFDCETARQTWGIFVLLLMVITKFMDMDIFSRDQGVWIKKIPLCVTYLSPVSLKFSFL